MQLRQHVMGQLRVLRNSEDLVISISSLSVGQAGDLERIANPRSADRADETAAARSDRDTDGSGHSYAFHAGLAQDPAAEIDDQAHILRDRNDIDRGNRAPHRMIPAQERLAGRDPAGLEVDQRLVEQSNSSLASALQVQLEDAAPDGWRRIPEGRKKQKRAAAVRLGVERHVRVFQKVSAPTPGDVIAMPTLAPISTR